MKSKKIPMRSCVVTHEKLPKNELLRIVKTNDNKVLVDISGKLNGKGAYIKKDIAVLDKAIINKSLDRALEIEISREIYEEIKNVIEN